MDLAEVFGQPTWRQVETALVEALTEPNNAHRDDLHRLLKQHGYMRQSDMASGGRVPWADLLREAEERRERFQREEAEERERGAHA